MSPHRPWHLFPAFILVLAATPARAFWPASPVGPFDLRAPARIQDVRVISDGAGGALVMIPTWSYETALRRIGANGLPDPRWDSVSLPGDAWCTPDSQGGLLAARSGTSASVFLHRLALDATPSAGWPAEGTKLRTQFGANYARVVADGSGGAIVGWLEQEPSRATWMRAQHVLANGDFDPAWGADAHPVFATPTVVPNVVTFPTPIACGDGAGGAYLGWLVFTGWQASEPFYYEIHRLFLNHVPADGGTNPAFGANGRGFDPSVAGPQIPLGLAEAAGGFALAWYGSRGTLQEFVDREGGSNGPSLILRGGSWVEDWSPESDGSVLHANAVFVGGSVTDARIHRSRRDGAPAPGWPEAGATFVAPATLYRNAAGYQVEVVSDGAGGAFVFWTAKAPNGGTRVRGQHLGPHGMVDPAWPADGQVVSPGDGFLVAAVATAPGEAVALWYTPSNAVLAQRVTLHPDPGVAAPGLAARDVPGDQGGRVLVTWQRSPLQSPPWSLVTAYRVSRRPGGAAGEWEEVATLTEDAPRHDLEVATFADSTPAGDHDMLIRVDALRSDGGQPLSSEVLAVSSVDDLAPAPPGDFTARTEAAGVRLTWSANVEPDLAGYRLFRSEAPDVPLAEATPLGFTLDREYFDPAAGRFHFQLVAEDVHGNRSPPVGLGPEGVPAVLATVHLAPPRPSPAQAEARLHFSLPVDADASFAVFDVSGRRVALLASGPQPRGWHDVVWNLRDSQGRLLPAGLYVVRLVTSVGSRQQRLMVIP